MKKLDLNSNRLTQAGTYSILRKIDGSNLQQLDLSNNKLGKQSVEQIITMLNNHKIPLKWLKLENTDINERAIIDIVGAVEDNPGLTRLNLAKNGISEGAATAIGKMLSIN